MRAIVPAAAVCAAMLISPSPSHIEASGVLGSAPHWTQAQIDARYDAYRQRINALHRVGATQARIDKVLADEFNIVALSHGSPVQLVATSSSDVSIYTPAFSYDNLLRHYVMSASWAWKACGSTGPCWAKDQVKVGAVGGPDAMGIKISRPIFRTSTGLSTSNNCGAAGYHSSQPDTDNGYGVGYIDPDSITNVDLGKACKGTAARYNWDSGTVSETFDFQNANCGGIRLQIDSKFSHTWQTTSVNSISISTSGIGIGWNSTSYRFQAIPSTPAYGYC